MKPVVVLILLVAVACHARDLRHETEEEHEHPHPSEVEQDTDEDVEDRVATTIRSIVEDEDEPEEFGIDFKHHNEEHDEMLEEVESVEEMSEEEEEEEVEEEEEEDEKDDYKKKWEEWNEENKYKLHTEKCLISLVKACDMKRFCYDPEKDLTPVVVGKQKIKGASCPKVEEDINSYQLAEPRVYDKCKSKTCSYCEEEKSEVTLYNFRF